MDPLVLFEGINLSFNPNFRTMYHGADWTIRGEL
jgi:hypothetical protein